MVAPAIKKWGQEIGRGQDIKDHDHALTLPKMFDKQFPYPPPHYYPWNTLVLFIEINYIYTHFLSETFYDKKFGTAAEILSYDLKTFEDIGTEPRPERGRGFSPHRVSRS